jgi:hypothetical protein
MAPDTAPAIAPSLSAFVRTWNGELGADRRAWHVDELPAVDDAMAFDIDLSPDMWLSGYLNPSTEGPVQVALFMVGDEAVPDDAAPEASAGHGHGGHDAHGGEPTGQDDLGHHDTADAAAVDFDPSVSHDAAVAVVRAASDADEGEAERIVADLGIGPDAVDAVATAEEEPVEVVAERRTFRFQLLRNVAVLSVRSEEPWVFDDSGS